MKPCNGCTQCCSLVPVMEISLPAYTACPHLLSIPAAHPGCGIYAGRPHSCRLWHCMWAKNDWDEELRPDRCGVVFDEVPDIVRIDGVEHPCMQAWVRPDVPTGFWREQPILTVVLATLEKLDMVLLFRRSDERAFSVWKGPDDRIYNNEDFLIKTKPRLREPELMRRQRAARLLANKT